MSFYRRIYTLIAAIIVCTLQLQAQDKPIGYWRSHMPYNTTVGVATDGRTVYALCGMTFFTYAPLIDPSHTTQYSKEDGMADVGMKCVATDAGTATTVLVYANGNIDVFKGNTFYNIPDLKIKTVAGSKDVNGIYTENGTAYLSTSIGILLIDLAKYEVSETYQFIKNNQVIPVNCFTGFGDSFYAATTNGVYRAAKNNPELQNFQVWTRIDSTKVINTMAVVNNTLYFADNYNVYTKLNDTLHKIYTTRTRITHIDAGKDHVLMCEYNDTTYFGDLKLIGMDNTVIDSFSALFPVQAAELADGSIWLADITKGLVKEIHGGPINYVPSGPSNNNGFDIYAHNKNIWVAHGGYNEGFQPNNWGYGMSNFVNDNWNLYQQYNYGPFGDSTTDIINVLKDEQQGTVYAGSLTGGLFTLRQDGSYEILKQNSIFDVTLGISARERRIVGLALDKSDNLWVAEASTTHQLYAKTPAGTWYKYYVPNITAGGPLVIDDNGQVWFAGFGGGGIAVFNHNNTLDVTTDDLSYHLGQGVGFGNLPSNKVYCLAKDKNNNIWVGTDNGIGIVSNCSAPFTQSPPCDAEIPIVQYDQFAGYLFAGNNVRSIAVDGANRKWVGTDNGIWLLSSDAGKIIYRFTAENSPLPSDIIQKISIDDVTGDVYISTDHGLVSYRSTATDGTTNNQDVLVFPDPVPSGYQGTIAIKGLAANADVRITDIDGQLVYRTKALGGQAVWNGLDYKGRRPQSGVYLIFASSSDGAQTYAGKILFMK